MTFTVFLADDHTVLRDALRFMLEAQIDGCKVVGDAATGMSLGQRHHGEGRPNARPAVVRLRDLVGICRYRDQTAQWQPRQIGRRPRKVTTIKG